MYKIAKNKAFTLAEVLITLLIIGVVASIIIPNLINDSQNAELRTALKKVYAELSLTTKQIVYDNGGTFIGLLSSDADDSGLKNIYKSHLDYVKSCNDAETHGCWYSSGWKTLSGNSADGYRSGSGLILKNGTLINFISLKADCSYQGFYYTKPAICAWIIVDINGFKKPNTIGKDVFYFNLLASRIEPWGAPDSDYYKCDSNGLYCATPALMQ